MLKAEVSAYAADLGISVNALVAVALRDYLDSRVPREVPPGPRVAAPVPLSGGPLRVVAPGACARVKSRKKRR